MSTIKLRPYQKELKKGIEAAFSSLKDKKERPPRVLAVLATGGGKTIIFNEIGRDEIGRGGVVLVLAHRRELVAQASQKYKKAYNIEAGIIKADERPNFEAPLQVASVQSLASWVGRIDKIEGLTELLSRVSLIIVDEAHRSKAATYLKVIEACSCARVLGVTATPWRLDGSGFADVYDDIVIGASVKELEALGFLCEAKVHITPLSGAELASIKTTAGDYNEAQLANLMIGGNILADAVKAYQEKAEGKRCLLFAVDIRHSKTLVKAFVESGIAAQHIDGSTAKADREQALEDFAQGKIKVLSNVGIATEGTDIPEVEAVLLARPTKSLSLFLQMCGRGARPYPGKKKYILLDVSNNVIEFNLPNVDRNWLGFFKRKKREKKKVAETLAIDVESQKLYTPRDLPRGVDIKLVDISDIESAALILDIVKKGQKKGILNVAIAQRVIIGISRDYKRKPTFNELLLVAQLTRGRLAQVKTWANMVGIDIPIEHREKGKRPEKFTKEQKLTLCKTAREIYSLYMDKATQKRNEYINFINEKNFNVINESAYKHLYDLALEYSENLSEKTLLNVGIYAS